MTAFGSGIFAPVATRRRFRSGLFDFEFALLLFQKGYFCLLFLGQGDLQWRPRLCPSSGRDDAGFSRFGRGRRNARFDGECRFSGREDRFG